MDVTKMPRKIWEHPDPQSTAMWRFLQDANKRYNLNLETFHDLYDWSCTQRSAFYAQLWDTQNWIHEGSYEYVVDESIPISKLPAWFPGVHLNWAENFLWTRPQGSSPATRSTQHKEDNKVAISQVREGNVERQDVTWGELRDRVARLAGAMKARGVGRGDRVVMVGAYAVETLVVFLATTWLGGIFSSSSTDMGVGGLLQRTVQVDPKLVFFDDGALYNGKTLDLRPKIEGMLAGLTKECPSFTSMIIVQRFPSANPTSHIPRTERLEAFLSSATTHPPPIIRVGFQDPMVIYYSSGTTGMPKAIVHGVGPLLMSLAKESVLHRDLSPEDVTMQYTTTGWIMYLLGVGQMICGAKAVFYDGSPFMPDLKVLLRVVAEHRVTFLGINPRWLGELMKNGIVPKEEVDLSSLKWVGSTGMVLKEQVFEWFADVGFPKGIRLANFSGGTDIAGCFVIDNPLSPIYAGGCPGGALGTPIAIYPHDLPPSSSATPLPAGTPGDLVATAAFPNVPLFLWNDSRPAPGEKYTSAYFARFDRAWAQSDFAVVHPRTRGIYLLGRSDGVLNPSGIRFGSADIYAIVERFFAADVAESLCVGQRRPDDADERVFLFVLMKPGKKFGRELEAGLKDAVARELTKRHVPKYIFEVPEIPTTVNGKKVELPVKQIISGNTIKPSGTLLNPQSLDFFYQFQKVEELVQDKAKL